MHERVEQHHVPFDRDCQRGIGDPGKDHLVVVDFATAGIDVLCAEEELARLDHLGSGMRG